MPKKPKKRTRRQILRHQILSDKRIKMMPDGPAKTKAVKETLERMLESSRRLDRQIGTDPALAGYRERMARQRPARKLSNRTMGHPRARRL